MIVKNAITQKLISSLIIFTMLAPVVFLSLKIKQAEALISGAPPSAPGVPGPSIGGIPGIAGSIPSIMPCVTCVPVGDLIAQGLLGVVVAETTVIATETTANTVLHSWENVFEYVIKETIKLLARRLLARMTQATINWINSDFHGAPLFLERPSAFFKDIAKSELKYMVDLFGYDDWRYPFGKQFARNAMASYKRQLAENAEYTLSKVMNQRELKLFRDDFDYGGWNGFLINTQYPQNNYLGFQILANDELAKRLEGTYQAPAKRVQSLLKEGMGFLSPQRCTTNDKYNNFFNEFKRPTFQFDEPFNPPEIKDETNADQRKEYNDYIIGYDTRRTAAENEWNIANICPGGLVNTTPGSVAANQVMQALGSPGRLLELDAALGNSVAAIFDALINHFFEKGLNALADFVNPQPSFNDNWSYDGDSLIGSDDYDYDAAASVLRIGENPSNIVNVLVRVGETTSERISGGSGYYIIKLNATNNTIVLDKKDITNETIAIAKIDVTSSSGNKLTITGVGPGTATFTVQDTFTSNPIQSITVNINGGNIGDLMIDPARIRISDTNIATIATIYGGEGPYFIIKDPNGLVATATVSATNLIVAGIGNGNTELRIKDSSTPEKTAWVKIIVGPDDLLTVTNLLTVTPSNISIDLMQTTSATISGGSGSYSVKPQTTNSKNTAVAEIDVSDPSSPKLKITAGVRPNNRGNSVIVQDSSNPVKEVLVNIKVNLNISINTGDRINIPIPIFKGVGPYIVTEQEDEEIATAEILPATPDELTITGLMDGKSLVTIQDSDGRTANITIETVDNSSAQLNAPPMFNNNVQLNAPPVQ